MTGGLSAAQTLQEANAFNPLSYGLMGAGRYVTQYGIPTISQQITPGSTLQNEIARLGSGTGAGSDWYTGRGGWGNYGE